MDVCKELDSFKPMKLLTYGTTLLGAYSKMLKLTNTKMSDEKNHRTKAQSFNNGRISIVQAAHYISTVRNRSIACHTEKDMKCGRFDYNHLPHHLMQCPVILVWIWGKKFMEFVNNKEACTIPFSLHFAEKNNINNINIKWGNYNPEDGEFILKHKDMRPDPDFIVLGSDSLETTKLSSKQLSWLINYVFFPDSKIKGYIYSKRKLLSPPTKPVDKYLSKNSIIEYEIRKAIYNYIHNMNPIPKEWKGWMSSVEFLRKNLGDGDVIR